MVDNHISLINIKYKDFISFLIIPIILIIIIALASLIDMYDTVKTSYLYINNQFVITIPIDYSDKVIHSDYVLLGNKKYNYKIVNIDYQYGAEYQTLFVEIDIQLLENQIGTIVFNYNKEKIIKKIIRLFF